MSRFNGVNLYQNRPKTKLVFAKKIRNFGALGALPQTPVTTSSLDFPLQISGYTPDQKYAKLDGSLPANPVNDR